MQNLVCVLSVNPKLIPGLLCPRPVFPAISIILTSKILEDGLAPAWISPGFLPDVTNNWSVLGSGCGDGGGEILQKEDLSLVLLGKSMNKTPSIRKVWARLCPQTFVPVSWSPR